MAIRRPSILALSSELPWPLNTGGHLRTFHLLRTLALGFDVRLVAATRLGQEDACNALQGYGITVCPALVPPRARWREALTMARGLITGEPYAMFRRHAWRAVGRVLTAECRKQLPAVLYLDHLDPLALRAYFPAQTPLVADLHNVYSLLVERAASEQARPLARWYLRREARLLRRQEAGIARIADTILTVSAEEGTYYGRLGAKCLRLVPNGVDCAAYATLPTGRPCGRPLLLYLGAMSWTPNVRAAHFLATQVLPAIRKRLPTARLRVIGRDPPAELLRLNGVGGVEVTGGVHDVVPHLREASLLAVPLEAGGGTRLKILEAFAAGLPVVSTAVGCEGIRAVPGEHLLTAPREQFAAAILTLLEDATLGTKLADRARELVRAHYDWTTVAQVAVEAVHGVLGVSP